MTKPVPVIRSCKDAFTISGQASPFQSEENWLMKLLKLTGIILIAFIISLGMSNSVWAKKGGNGQTGNGGGGGGNTSPDPEYAIQADIYQQQPDPEEPELEPDMIDEGCDAYNPDLKGPGIAYGGFYDHIDVAPVTCAAVTTSSGDSFYIRTLGLEASESGLITAVWLTGRNIEGVLFDTENENTPISSFQAPTDGSPFDLPVNATVYMEKCSKVRGKTTCTPAGSLFVGTLVFAFIGF
jgi:hypothetical protein